MVKQGDIIFLNFNPTEGNEQKGQRPALVLSNNDFNRHSNLTFVCPITSSKRKTPFQIPLDERTKTQGCILCDQARMVDLKSRKHSVLETLPDDILDYTLRVFKAIIGK
ncbi:MAG: type II toxin-antitoxin system PemK/MazF family toxin [Sphaerochaetaceae bacterium]|nr:type II toxin-antitoxin system PemK/MazF family toxin [Sphaerochaetaceae bacterium]